MQKEHQFCLVAKAGTSWKIGGMQAGAQQYAQLVVASVTGYKR